MKETKKTVGITYFGPSNIDYCALSNGVPYARHIYKLYHYYQQWHTLS